MDIYVCMYMFLLSVLDGGCLIGLSLFIIILITLYKTVPFDHNNPNNPIYIYIALPLSLEGAGACLLHEDCRRGYQVWYLRIYIYIHTYIMLMYIHFGQHQNSSINIQREREIEREGGESDHVDEDR